MSRARARTAFNIFMKRLYFLSNMTTSVVDSVNMLDFSSAVCREPDCFPPFVRADGQTDVTGVAPPVTGVC